MQLNNLTVRAQEALAAAHQLAERRRHPEITPLHLLWALMADETGIVRPLVAKVGGNREQIEQLIEAELSRQAEQSGAAAVGPDLQKTLGQASREAAALQDEYISTEHLLLALLSGKGPAAEVLRLSAVDRTAC